MKNFTIIICLLQAVILTTWTFTWATPEISYNSIDIITKEPWVDVRDFGARGDGTTNDTAAVQNAIRHAGRTKVIYFPAGVYLLNKTINVTTPGAHILGATPGFVYGPSGSATVFKFIGGTVGINTFLNPNDPLNVPYITIENITVDGNSILLTGFDGGFFSNLINSTFINCAGSGARLKSAQTTTIRKCGFNGNLDGLEIQSGGTVYPTECVFRQNSRYGVNIAGTGGVIPFERDIFESNGGPGLNISGDVTQITFKNGCYFEQNDAMQGAKGYHVTVQISGVFNSEGIVFDGAYFASTGLTKVAKITAGKVEFNNCTNVGDRSTTPITKADGAEVVVKSSFQGYPFASGAKVVPEVTVDQSTALDFSEKGSLDISPQAIVFGNRNFSIGLTLEPHDCRNRIRTLLDAKTRGLKLIMLGSLSGIGEIAFSRVGQKPFHQSRAVLSNNTPCHIVYTRDKGVGSLYLNGVLLDTFPDTNNYSGTEHQIGNDFDNNGMNAKLFNFNFFNMALTSTQVFELWRNGGNARAARIGGLSLNLMFDARLVKKIYNSASQRWINFTGTVDWLNPTSPLN